NREQPLWLGSIKSNLGHTQAAAGIAGIIKMVEAMRHQRLPRTLHADEPSPHIDWSDGRVRLLTEELTWSPGRPRRAAVSSFGISGTNAHIILEEPPPIVVPEPEAEPTPEHLPLLLSGKSPGAVMAFARQLAAGLDGSLLDVAYSLATTRSQLEHRAVVIAESRERAVETLSQLGDALPTSSASGKPKLAMLFTGQGAQRHAMGRALFGANPVFRAALEQIWGCFDPLLDRSL